LFVSSAGPVLGTVEMLNAISTNRQPFRFVSLEENSQRRLRAAIDSLIAPVDPVWIAKYRASMARRKSSVRSVFAIALVATALIILCLEALLHFRTIP
jgi:hypothetical protein